MGSLVLRAELVSRSAVDGCGSGKQSGMKVQGGGGSSQQCTSRPCPFCATRHELASAEAANTDSLRARTDRRRSDARSGSLLSCCSLLLLLSYLQLTHQLTTFEN